MAMSENQIDLEKAVAYTVEEVTVGAIETLPGRPSIPALMESLIDNCDSTKRAIVGACGPEGLLEMVKSTESQCIRPDGPSFTLYTEVGWLLFSFCLRFANTRIGVWMVDVLMISCTRLLMRFG